MNAKTQNIPSLRFPEFEGEWEEKRLGEIAKIFDGTHQTPKYTDEGVPFVSVEDIGNINETKKFISEYDFEKDFKNKPQSSDILMTRITAGVIGATAIVQSDEPLAYYVSLALIRPNEATSSGYLTYRIESTGFKRELNKRIIHVAFPKKINLGEIGQCQALMPAPPEQKKIAGFLGAVDEKIAQLARRKSLLEDYKKGVMQKIFAQEIRFTPDPATDKENHGDHYPDWEVKKLGELVDIIGGGTPETTKASYWGGEIQWFTPSEIKAKYLNKSVRTITAMGLKNSSAKLLPIGALLLSTRATVGDCGIALMECATNQGFQSLVMKDDNYNEFWYYWIAMNKKEFLRRSSGSTFLEISKSEIQKIKVSSLHPDEQKKIADFLGAIDNKISLARDALEKARDFKKGLLQQMFV